MERIKYSDVIKNEITELRGIINNLSVEFTKDVENMAGLIYETLVNNGCIFFCGNGGSCSQSQHLAAEFSGKYSKNRKPLKALALTSDTAVISCVGNDYGYKYIFSRQNTNR